MFQLKYIYEYFIRGIPYDKREETGEVLKMSHGYCKENDVG